MLSNGFSGFSPWLIFFLFNDAQSFFSSSFYQQRQVLSKEGKTWSPQKHERQEKGVSSFEPNLKQLLSTVKNFNKRRQRQEAGIIKFIDPFALQVLYYFKRFFLFCFSAYFSLENTITILELWKIVIIILHMFENLKEKSSGNKKTENKINQCKTKRRKLN